MEPHRLPQLNDELIYQIIFCMEDQSGHYLFDLQEGEVISEDLDIVDHDGERYAELPHWTPADGFRIMEKFVSSLRNPVFSQQLRESLGFGKGVFRRFKNVLKDEPAVERLWFYFKEKEMKREIYSWYEQLFEAQRMLRQGDEPEEDTAELILSDFIISEDSSRFSSELQVITSLLGNEFSHLDEPVGAVLSEEYLGRMERWNDQWIAVFLESPTGDLAGCMGAEPLNDAVWEVQLIYVFPRYRGLGVFSLLNEALCRRVYAAGALQLLVRLSGTSEVLHQPLERRGFIPTETRYSLDVSKWIREKHT